jgi:L-threonylcarbamoyladenylate synthase
MDVVSKEELFDRLHEFLKKFREELFIHPTDTIYGLGCDATNSKAINKLRQVKQDPDKPMSIIAPNKEWIKENCSLNEEAKKHLDLLPGPYTLVLPIKNKGAIAPETNNYFDTIGVRIPDHWISEIVAQFGKPIVTTSANIHGDNFITKIEELHSSIKPSISFAIEEGEIKGKPSTVIKFAEVKEVLRD